MKSTIISIGSEVRHDEDGLLILFGVNVTEAMAPVVVVQDFGNEALFDLEQGDFIFFGDQKYEILYLGELCNENMRDLGHITVQFVEVPETPLANSIYLAPGIYPKIAEGMQILYQKKG